VCLLIALSGVVPGAPLVMAANRDERLDRPAEVMTVLRPSGPRVLGGRDLLAGGTWLAVSDAGVVAGLTNRPTAAGRDPSRRSRGELPLRCAAEPTAAAAVAALTAQVDPADYNPCWLLVGDAGALFSVSIGPGQPGPEVEPLSPGLHVLENAPLRAGSAKAAAVREAVSQGLACQPGAGPEEVTAVLQAVLCDHRPAVAGDRADEETGRVRPAALSAACVHADGYGTRSASVITVPAAGLPSVLVADGKPCQAPMRDASDLWGDPPPAGGSRRPPVCRD
jgi:uncharacterized protein with NRDE domain